MRQHPFERALAFSGGEGGYVLDVDDSWAGQLGHLFGGFLLAAVVRAADSCHRPRGFSNLDGLVHFHSLRATDWFYIETGILTGSGGYASAQTQTWSAGRRLLGTAVTQLAFFDIGAAAATSP